jgi:hypothetical protein
VNSLHGGREVKTAFDAGLCLGSGLADTVTVCELGHASGVRVVPALAFEMRDFRCVRATSSPMPDDPQAAPLSHTRRNWTRNSAEKLTSLQDLAARVTPCAGPSGGRTSRIFS